MLPTRICLLALALALCVAVLAPGRAAPAVAPHVAALTKQAAKRQAKKRRQAPGSRAATLARRWLGVPYQYGGSSPSGFDCSGFTSYVYGRLGVQLPHNAAAQFSVGKPVPRSRLRPGDLLFFSGLGHVGMYVGRGRMIHAPHSGAYVRVERLAGNYGARLVGARRVVRSVRFLTGTRS